MYQQLCAYIPGGVNSPANSFPGMGVSPFVIDHAYGDMLVDTDGNSYIDYCCSWGALIHGHANPAILEPVKEQMDRGTSYGLPGKGVLKIAKKIVETIPSIEMVRFVSSGTEATAAAVRLARGFTKRDYIVKFIGNYHGHADQFLVKAGSSVAALPEASSSGIPADAVKHTLCLPYNDIESCRALFRNPQYKDQIAAVIAEPIAGNMGVVPATKEFLLMLREETEKSGSILIFDEVISGFRVGPQGAQGLYGITPDLTCLGKVIGGGFPAAAFGGSAEIMNYIAPIGSVFQAGTLSGNPVALEAGYQALRLLDENHAFENLEAKTNRITQPVREHIQKQKLPACIQQVGSLFTLFLGTTEVHNFDDVLKCDSEWFKRFFKFMLEKGIYLPPSQHEAWFVSTVHTEKHLDYTAKCILDFFSSK